MPSKRAEVGLGMELNGAKPLNPLNRPINQGKFPPHLWHPSIICFFYREKTQPEFIFSGLFNYLFINGLWVNWSGFKGGFPCFLKKKSTAR
jgi:hypothetical protein